MTDEQKILKKEKIDAAAMVTIMSITWKRDNPTKLFQLN